MTAKTFFKKVGKSIQGGFGEATKAAGKAAGGVLGAAAGRSILSSLTTAGPEVAEGAVVALKTGGYIRAPRNKAVPAILHGKEWVIPANAKVTKHQKKVIASNKRKQKLGKFVYE